MDQYSENQLKEDLAILGIKEGNNLTSRLLTISLKKLAYRRSHNLQRHLILFLRRNKIMKI